MNFLNTLPFNFFLYSVKLKEEWVFNQTNEKFTLVQFSSVTQSCPAHSEPMNCSTPGFPGHHQLLKHAQTHVHWVMMQSNHLILRHPLLLLLSTFPASQSLQMSQFFTSGGQSIRASASASVLPINIQGWFPLGLTHLILQSKGLSRIFSSTTVQKHHCLFNFNSSPPFLSLLPSQL